MTGPAEGPTGSNGFDDPTRDIRLPPPPGTPPLTVRPEWSSYAAPGASKARSTAQAPAAPEVAPDPGPPNRTQRLDSEPTDELFPGRRLRDPTLKFEQGSATPAPVVPPVHPPVRTPDDGRSRRWPWVLIVLLPIVVIVGSGIWLFLLLSHP